MKFIAKNSNLHIILRPGMQAQPLTGTPAKATVSVRFQSGVANVEQEELVQMMLMHPGFNQDFIAADDIGTDPYAYLREDAEPTHVLTEMKYGHPVGRNVSPIKAKMPPEILKMIQDQATLIAKQMLPSMVAETLKIMVGERQEDRKEKEVDPNPSPKKDGRGQHLKIYRELVQRAKEQGIDPSGKKMDELKQLVADVKAADATEGQVIA